MLIHLALSGPETPWGSGLILDFQPFTHRDRWRYLWPRSEEGFPWDPPALSKLRAGQRALAILRPGPGPGLSYWVPGGFRQPVWVISAGCTLKRDPRTPAGFGPADLRRRGEFSYTELWIGDCQLRHLFPWQFSQAGVAQGLLERLADGERSLLLADGLERASHWAARFDPAYERILAFLDQLPLANPRARVLGLVHESRGWLCREIQARFGPDAVQKAPAWRFERETSLELMQVGDYPQKAQLYSHLLSKSLPARLGGSALSDLLDPGEAGLVYGLSPDPGIGLCQERFFNAPGLGLMAEQHQLESEGKRAEPGIHIQSGGDPMQVRFVVHTSLPDSLSQWCQQVSAAGKDGSRAHLAQIIQMPAKACEAAMAAQASPVPACTAKGCPFGKESLCDYGKQHLRIQNQALDPLETFMELALVLDRLIAFFQDPAQIIRLALASPEARARIPKALYWLKTLGVLKQAEQSGERMAVSGFRPRLDAETARAGLLAVLKRNMPGSGRFQARMARAWSEQAAAVQARLKRATAAGKLVHLSDHAEFFHQLSRYLVPLFVLLRQYQTAMGYFRIWHLKVWIQSEGCRYRHLFAAQGWDMGDWRCGVCDGCDPQRGFHFPVFPESARPFGREVYGWLSHPPGGDWPSRANAFAETHAQPGLYHLAMGILSGEPANLGALYLAQALCPPAEKGKHAAALLLAARDQLAMIPLCELYEGAPDSVREPLFDILDDDYGPLAVSEGEKWLHEQSMALDIAEARQALLGGRRVLNALANTAIEPLEQKLATLLETL